MCTVKVSDHGVPRLYNLILTCEARRFNLHLRACASDVILKHPFGRFIQNTVAETWITARKTPKVFQNYTTFFVAPKQADNQYNKTTARVMRSKLCPSFYAFSSLASIAFCCTDLIRFFSITFYTRVQNSSAVTAMNI